MKKIKVLVLDNNIVVRQAIAGILNREPDVTVRVSGELIKSEQLVNEENPDVVLLDIEDSATDGYTTFNTLRVRFPKLPLVVISSRSEGGAQAALYALRKGAVDVLTKPEKSNALLFATRHLAKRLPPMIQGIKCMVGSDALDGWTAGKKEARSPVDTEEQPEKEKARMSRGPVRLVVIGGGMGGPKALNDILRKLPANFPVPVVIVQHLPQFYTRALVQLFKKTSPLTVREALKEVALIPGTAWLAPGGRHCEITQKSNRPFIRVHHGPRENGERPSIDVLFRSAARLYGNEVLGIILSGNGVDGLSGVRAIQEGGGRIIIQDPEDAVVDDLPLYIIREGLADYYYPAEQIGHQLLKQVLRPRKSRERDKYDNVILNRDQEYFRSI